MNPYAIKHFIHAQISSTTYLSWFTWNINRYPVLDVLLTEKRAWLDRVKSEMKGTKLEETRRSVEHGTCALTALG